VKDTSVPRGDQVHEKQVPQDLDSDEIDRDRIENARESHTENIRDSFLQIRSVQGEWIHKSPIFSFEGFPMWDRKFWQIEPGKLPPVDRMSLQHENVIS
jgi:hypothetical protein